ncbi:MAG: hypothetical protein HRU70_04040 [Phycisphaeraceae bacterium]|nr:MAG: hypothetical protein HRU70_04040 [Phycisphaeraceae bacterium]
MICRITGNLAGVEGNAALVEVGGGLTYEVLMPAYVAERVARSVGGPVTFITLQYLESEGQGSSYIPRLLGFLSVRERRFFEVFTTVKGIGNKRALRALTAEPAAVARAIESRDTRWLTGLPEIGKRMAETVVAELHGKVGGFLSDAEAAALGAGAEVKPVSPAGGGPMEEAVGALMALGEGRGDAERKVALVLARSPGRSLTVEEIVTAVFGAG